jgi:hypothetical protein
LGLQEKIVTATNNCQCKTSPDKKGTWQHACRRGCLGVKSLETVRDGIDRIVGTTGEAWRRIRIILLIACLLVLSHVVEETRSVNDIVRDDGTVALKEASEEANKSLEKSS